MNVRDFFLKRLLRVRENPVTAQPEILLLRYDKTLAPNYVGKPHVCQWSGQEFLVSEVRKKASNGAAILVGTLPDGSEWQSVLKA